MLQQEIINWDELDLGIDTTRSDACGLHQWRIDPETGKEYYAPWSCDDYRNCEKGCRARRAKKEVQGLTEYFASDNVFLAEMTEAEAKRFTRQLRDNEQYYCRIPRPDDRVMIIHNAPTDEKTGLRPDGNVAICDLSLESWLKGVPERKRIVKGGKANKVTVERKEDDWQPEEYKEFDSWSLHCNASEYEIRLAFKEASHETPLPQTWQDIPICINQKMEITKKILESKGHVVYDVYLRIRIKVDLVPRWSRSYVDAGKVPI